MTRTAAAAAVVIVVVAMVMAVVVLVAAGLALVIMMVMMMMSSRGRGRPREQGGRGGGSEDLDASGPRGADLMDVSQQLVQRRHVHHCLGEGLLGAVVDWDSAPCCHSTLIAQRLSLLKEVQ